jgi:1-acyl-sn-glycerol-3-phosphate acyltransferase
MLPQAILAFPWSNVRFERAPRKSCNFSLERNDTMRHLTYPEQKRPIIEPDLRYLIGRAKIGLPDRCSYLRTLLGMAIWLGGPPLLARLLGRLGARTSLAQVQRWWAWSLRYYLGVRLDLQGLEQIDPHTTYLVTPLHEGFADVLALLHLPLPMRFVLRDEFENWPLLGPYVRDTGQITIRPEQGTRSYRQLLRAARAVVAGGESLVLFPQGSVLGIEIDFMVGAFGLAQALQCPILPVALTGSHRVWEFPFTPRLRYGQRISLHVLPPISAEACRAYTADELRRAVQRQIKAEALSGKMALPRRFVPVRDGYWDGYAYEIDPQFADLAAEIARHRRGSS